MSQDRGRKMGSLPCWPDPSCTCENGMYLPSMGPLGNSVSPPSMVTESCLQGTATKIWIVAGWKTVLTPCIEIPPTPGPGQDPRGQRRDCGGQPGQLHRASPLNFPPRGDHCSHTPALPRGFSGEEALEKEAWVQLVTCCSLGHHESRGTPSPELFHQTSLSWSRSRVSVGTSSPGPQPQCAHLESKRGDLWPLPSRGSWADPVWKESKALRRQEPGRS